MRIVNRLLLFCIVFLCIHGLAFSQSEPLKAVETLMLKDSYAQAAKECQKIISGRFRATAKSKAHYLLGVCLIKESRFDEARSSFKTIVQRYSSSQFRDDAALGIADSYFLNGDCDLAERHYRDFISDFPQSDLVSVARRHLAQCKEGFPAASRSYYAVQLGCFASKRNAQKLRDELINRGHRGYILEVTQDNLYHVRVGKFGNRLDAELLEEKLKAQGYETKVCP